MGSCVSNSGALELLEKPRRKGDRASEGLSHAGLLQLQGGLGCKTGCLGDGVDTSVEGRRRAQHWGIHRVWASHRQPSEPHGERTVLLLSAVPGVSLDHHKVAPKCSCRCCMGVSASMPSR